MATFLIPDKTITMTIGGKTLMVKQKIIPDSLRAEKDVASYVKKGQPLKPCGKLGDSTGKSCTELLTNVPICSTRENPPPAPWPVRLPRIAPFTFASISKSVGTAFCISRDTSFMASSKPSPRPSARFAPIWSWNSFDGEAMPKKLLIESVMLWAKLRILSLIHCVMSLMPFHRSEERRVGKGCRSRWSPYH